MPSRQRLNISELLNPEGEEDCVQFMNDDAIVSAVLSAGDSVDREVDDVSVAQMTLPSVKEQLRALF